MTNTELSEKINSYLKGSKAKAKKFEDLVAVNFNLLDYNLDMYVEVKDGILSVMPYHYDDYQADVTGSSENIDKIFSGDLSMKEAAEQGLVSIKGDFTKFFALECLIPAKKSTKPAEKAEAKPAAKPEAKPAAKPEAKPAEQKNAAAKPAVTNAAPAPSAKSNNNKKRKK